MDADCEIVPGKLTGSNNHALCDIIETDTKQVIAHDPEEYKTAQTAGR